MFLVVSLPVSMLGVPACVPGGVPAGVLGGAPGGVPAGALVVDISKRKVDVQPKSGNRCSLLEGPRVADLSRRRG